jgi:hypothetical protein
MNAKDGVRFFDLSASDTAKIDESEAKYQTYQIRKSIEEIQLHLGRIDDTLIGLVMRDSHGG